MAQKCLYFLYIGCYKNRFLVPETGLEPARTRHMLLRHTCIPISPLGHVFIITRSYEFWRDNFSLISRFLKNKKLAIPIKSAVGRRSSGPVVGRPVFWTTVVLLCCSTEYCVAGELAALLLFTLETELLFFEVFWVFCSCFLSSMMVFSSFLAVLPVSTVWVLWFFFYTLLIAEVMSHAPKIKTRIATITAMIMILIRWGRLASWFLIIILHKILDTTSRLLTLY